MLSLAAAHVRERENGKEQKPLVWVDIGGGTGMFISPSCKEPKSDIAL